jgi:hypothetical protein
MREHNTPHGGERKDGSKGGKGEREKGRKVER